ncbi:MAG: SGNH/GDSL hydrolase family protein [Victivallaceae bacterium]|jgi:lysophospholipase L1-like esterase|nr:SGNH/GDSL hydrolase family protein [Victivallaceae bacterium]MDD5663945.1 SGNH/GDSL hydrolase family protein [Victivallaceae bacterium]
MANKKFTILFQGDSITDAGRSREEVPPDDGTGLGSGYPALIAARLLCSQPERKWHFYNRGISGNRVVDLYARWKIDALNLKPDVISILVGVNDTWHEFKRDNGVEVPRYEEFYRMLLRWTTEKLPKTKLILLEPFVLNFGEVEAPWVPEMDQRREVVARLSKEFGTEFIPLQSIINRMIKIAPPQHWLRDGVHPLPAGHQLIADAWLSVFSHMFSKLK